MKDETKELLRKLAGEMTDNGNDMGGLLRTREEVVFWLKEKGWKDDADMLDGVEPFRFRGNDDGKVWILTGPAFTTEDELINFGDDA